jgi:hypothetical protein
MDDEVPILDEENHSTWRIEMRVYLKTMGARTCTKVGEEDRAARTE